MRSYHIAALALIVAAPLAHANLASVDLASPGDALLTLDSSTGFRWLDLTETRNFSCDAMDAELLPGGQFYGFRRASAAEVDVLFTSAGMATRGWDVSLEAGVNNLLYLAGELENGFRVGSQAFTSDVVGLGHGMTSHFLAPNEGPTAYALAINAGSGVNWYASNEIGHWLIQVPTPGATAMFAAAGLLAARRRR